MDTKFIITTTITPTTYNPHLQLFEPTLLKICQHISAVLAEPDVGKISHLFLVGGFAESPLLQVVVMGMVMVDSSPSQ